MFKIQVCLLVFSISLSLSPLQAFDVRVSVDSNIVLIGSPFNIQYSVEKPLVRLSPHWDYSGVENISALVVLSAETSEKENFFHLNKQLVVFDTGRVVLPSVRVISARGVEMDTFFSPELELTVLPPPDFVPDLLPIRPIIDEPAARKWWPVVIVALVVLAVLATLLIFFSGKKRAGAKYEKYSVPPDPNLEALKALELLEKENWIARNEIHHFHSELNYIFRKWIERSFGIAALGMTGSELSIHLKDIGVREQYIRDWTEILMTIDGVKYAKAKPPVEFHQKVFSEVKEMVEKEIEREGKLKEKSEQ